MKLSLTAAAISTAAIVLLPSAAGAQEVVTPGPVIVQQAPPQPAPATVVVVRPARPVSEETTSEATGPSMAMVGSGLVLFGLSYVPALVVGTSSRLDADHTLVVPIAGPWMDLAQRPGCYASGSACNGENTSKVLLVTDGVLQAASVLVTLSGLFAPAYQTTTVQSAKITEPTLHLTPAAMGSGYGMAALGTF
jgi:hypothetical protein